MERVCAIWENTYKSSNGLFTFVGRRSIMSIDAGNSFKNKEKLEEKSKKCFKSLHKQSSMVLDLKTVNFEAISDITFSRPQRVFAKTDAIITRTFKLKVFGITVFTLF